MGVAGAFESTIQVQFWGDAADLSDTQAMLEAARWPRSCFELHGENDVVLCDVALWFVAPGESGDLSWPSSLLELWQSQSWPLVAVVETPETAEILASASDVELFDILLRDEVTPALLTRCLRQAAERSRERQADLAQHMTFETLFHNPHTMMWLLDPQTMQLVDANEAACQFYGYTRDELLEKKVTDFNVLPSSRVAREVRRALTGRCQQFQFQHRLSNGEVRDIEVFSGPITTQTADGPKVLLYSMLHDVTMRRQTLERQTMISQGLHAMLTAADELLKYSDVEVLLRRAVELGREKLGLERCTIFLIDNAEDRVLGSYTNNRYGRTVDLRELQYKGVEEWLELCQPLRDQRWRVNENEMFEWDGEKRVSLGRRGWVAVTLLQAEDGVVGSFHNDTAWTGSPLDPVQQELVAVYCSLLGNIIQRKRADAALRESEKRFRLLAENATDIILRLDPFGKILYVSPSIERILGYEPHQVLGTSIYNFAHPDEVDRMVNFHRDLDPSTEEYHLTGQSRRRDNSYVWLETIGRPIRDPQSGEIREYHAASRDISTRRKTEEALRESEKRFRAFMDNTPAMTFIKDGEGRYIYFNKTTEKLYHTSLNELQGKTNFTRLPQEIAQQLRENDLKVLSTSQAHEFLENVPTPDGTEHLWLTFKFPLTDARGERYVGGVAVDVTQQKQFEKALRQSEERLRTVVDSAPVVLWAIDRNGIFTFSQGRGLRVLEPRMRDAVGRSIFELYADHPQVVRNARRVLGGEEFTEDVQVDQVVLETRLTPLRGETGEVLGAIGVATDITDRRSAEERLRRSEMQMNEAQQLAHFGSWDWDIPTGILSWSAELFRIHGLEPQSQEMTYKYFLDCVHPDDRDYVREVMEGAYHNVWPVQFYHRIVRPDGSIRMLHSRCVTVLNETNEPLRMVGTSQDVTERKEAEDALQKSEERLRALVQSLDEIVFEFDGQGTILGVWTSNENLLFRPSFELLKCHVREVFGDEYGRTFVDAFNRVMHTGESESLEYSQRVPIGQRWFLARISPIRTPDGACRSVCLLARDITLRKLADEALRKSEERFRLLVEGVQDYALCLLDPQGHIVSWNVGAQRISGYGSDEIIGRHCSCFYVPEDVESQKPQHELDIARREGRFDDEGWRRRRDGTRFWATVVLTTLYDENNSIRGFSLVTRDISERRRNEQSLWHYTARLENLLEIDQAILMARSPQEIADVALHRLCPQLGCAGAAVSVFNFENDEIVVLGTRGATAWEISPGQHLRFDEVALPEDIAHLYRQSPQAEPDITTPQRRDYIFWQRGASDEESPDVRSLPLVAQGEIIGVLDLRTDGSQAFDGDKWIVAREVAGQLAIAIQQARLFEQVRSGRAQLQVLSHRLIEAQEAERRHIARELHDEIGQVLTAVKLNLQGIQRFSKDEQLAARMNDSIDIVEHALQQVRDLSLNLRPSLLDDLGLVAALRWFIDRFANRSEMQVRLQVDTDGSRYASSVETACFRIVQEALTNAGRHSGAQNVDVRVEQTPDGLQLTINDDGRGFDVRAMRERAAQGSSLGLPGMEERVVLAGGSLEIESASERGTTLRAIFPPEALSEDGLTALNGHGSSLNGMRLLS
jgi:PAS domain S-box-containing protein